MLDIRSAQQFSSAGSCCGHGLLAATSSSIGSFRLKALVSSSSTSSVLFVEFLSSLFSLEELFSSSCRSTDVPSLLFSSKSTSCWLKSSSAAASNRSAERWDLVSWSEATVVLLLLTAMRALRALCNWAISDGAPCK